MKKKKKLFVIILPMRINDRILLGVSCRLIRGAPLPSLTLGWGWGRGNEVG